MRLQEYPETIERECIALQKVNDELTDVREQIRDGELEASGKVMDAKDESGKARYTNDKAREIAARKLLKSDKAYQRDRKRERELDGQKTVLAAKIERLRKEYQLALIDHEAEKLGRRAA